MNSQIFETNRHSKSNNGKLTGLAVGTVISFHWLSALLLFAVVILFPERPAWGDDFERRISTDGIQECASQVGLGGIPKVLADEGGYIFYLNEEMAQTRINIRNPLTA